MSVNRAAVFTTDALSGARLAVLLGTALLVAAALYYFIGVDEGMTSVFGNNVVLHELVHDARHLLGFPCH